MSSLLSIFGFGRPTVPEACPPSPEVIADYERLMAEGAYLEARARNRRSVAEELRELEERRANEPKIDDAEHRRRFRVIIGGLHYDQG